VRRLLLIKIHKCDFAKYIFDALSKCDLSLQIIIALLNIQRHVYISGIRNPTIEFLKALISFLFYSCYSWFWGARRILPEWDFARLQTKSSYFPRDEKCKRIAKVFWLRSAATIYCRIGGNKYLSIRATIAPLWRYVEGQGPGSVPCTPRTFPHCGNWNAAQISELKLRSTFSGLGGGSAGKIRDIIYLATRSHSWSGTRLLRFNRFRFFPPKLRRIPSDNRMYTLSTEAREVWPPDYVWMIDEETNLYSLYRRYSSSFENISLLRTKAIPLFHFACSCLFFLLSR